MKEILDVPFNAHCKLDVYLPDKDGFDMVVYFHGGGLESGDKHNECYRDIGAKLVENGYGFISANYRMYPDGAKFPTYLEDAADAVAFAQKHAKEYGGNGGLYVMGQSAGAWISVMLCVEPKFLANVGVNTQDILGWGIDSAQMTSHFNILQKEKSCTPFAQRIDECAPLYYVDESTKFSRMILYFYEEDMPCRVEQNMLFYKAVKHFNPQADIEYKLLPLGHCHASSRKDEDGEYRFVKEILPWLAKGKKE